MPVPYPLINGIRYDWSCAEITITPAFGPPIVQQGIKSLSYKHELKPGEARGNRAQLIGRTRGKYDVSGSIELYMLEYNDFIVTLGDGYLEKAFDITAQFSTNGVDVVTHNLIGCRLTGPEHSMSEGEEALVVKSDLHIMMLIEQGRTPLNRAQMMR